MATACNKRPTRFHLAQCYDIEQNKTYYTLCQHKEKLLRLRLQILTRLGGNAKIILDERWRRIGEVRKKREEKGKMFWYTVEKS